MQNEPLKITGELTNDPDVCLFHVNRTLTDGWRVLFDRADDTADSPLPAAMMAVEGIVRVAVQDDTITVVKNVPQPWQQLASEMAKAIRATCAEGEVPPIDPARFASFASVPMDGVADQVQAAIDAKINPALAGHGGYVRLDRIEGHDVYLEMGGGCQGCSSARSTIRLGVERVIRHVAPQVRRVIDITDHASGANPYFS